MASTTKKGSKNKKAKLRRPSVMTPAKQAQTIAELRQRFKESLQRENATATENVRLFQELKESLEQQTATSEILGVIASSPTELQPVLDAIAQRAARVCGSDDATIRLLEGDEMILAGVNSLLSQTSLGGITHRFPPS